MRTKSILDPAFKYTNAVSTDLKKVFARERRRLAEPTRGGK